MTWQELYQSSRRQGRSIYIDKVFPRGLRGFLRAIFGLLALASFIASLFGSDTIFDGVALLSFVIFCIFLFFEFFYNSSKFAGVKSRLPERLKEKANAPSLADYTTAQVLYGGFDTDLSRGLLQSSPGSILLFRLGISPEEVKNFIESQRNYLTESSVNFDIEFVSFGDYAKAIYMSDKALSSFISAHSVSSEEFAGAADWISHELELELRKDRWWSRDNLESFPSIGSSLDYGMAYELSKFGLPLERGAIMSEIDLEGGYRKKETETLENILVRKEEANAIIIDDDESIAKAILLRLLKKIKSGQSFFALEHKNIIELDWQDLLAQNKSQNNPKAELEREILTLLRGSEAAGNIIIYIPNLPSFMASAKGLGINLSSLLGEFLGSHSLQIVGHSTKNDFHFFIETNASLLRMFERLIPEEDGIEASMPAILEKARHMEAQSGRRPQIFFSYPAVLAIAKSADRYITYGEMPSKAYDLLIEITPWALEQKIPIVMESHVSAFVSQKTGIISGEIGKEESEKLSHIEKTLHERIVGQNEAVSAIASALRRARSGITNPKRPFASFLFLGPTGVGKTETSKVLAENFFGGEDKIIRFDMSEYKEADALPALIGNYTEGKSGLLASKIRDNPYGVLLLDELEKASPDVLDLFLAVLDEGEFTDALGNKVNCRNLIIIATSNAGSDMIWKMVQDKEDLNKNEKKIIDNLIEQRIYRPEFINRFDGVVIFHPLETGELDSIAKLMFEKTAERIKRERNIELKMAPSLMDYLVSTGSDKEFGARSLNRIMQQKIEDFVARKIISGELNDGSTLEITKEDVDS